MRIETKRLIMLPITYEFVCSRLEGNKTYIEELGYSFSEEHWEKSEISEILPIFKGQLKDKDITGFCPWIIINKSSNRVIGNCGCHGEPDNYGCIEVGYEIDKDYRNVGFATEAMMALISWLYSTNKVSEIVAECKLENLKSQRVLKKLGMSEFERGIDTVKFIINNKNIYLNKV